MANVNATQQMFATSSSSDRSTPIEHLDYDYIGKCQDPRELEKIYKVLRSGTEGYYPDLVSFCEKRLADLAPTSKLLRKEVKPATEYDLGKEEWTKLNNDVKEWADDITKQGNEDGEVSAEEKLPPVRNRGVMNTSGKKNESSKEWGKPSAERIKGSDFRTWDKYDADAEESKIDEQAKDESMKAAYDKLAKARSAAEARESIDTSGMSDRERETVANREKDKGNEAFRASDYQEAILYYSRSLSVVASAPAFNNRSLARIKLGEFEGAVEDCTKVLHLEPTNIKALLRRGTARKSLKDFELALKDLQAVLQVEPNNKQALDMVNDVVTKMEKDKTQTDGELKKNGSPTKGGQQLPNGETKPKSGGRRLVIQEVEDEEVSGEEEYADASEKEGSVSTKTSDMNGVENGTGSPARNGTSETDGCVSSKTKKQGPSSASASPPVGKDASQITHAANQGSKEDLGSKEMPVPTPPKPAPPLPAAVVTLKDAGNDFFKKGQYGEANDSYSKAIKMLEKEKEVHQMGLSTLFSNRASCHLKSGSPKSCVEDCTSALALNPNNVKTYLKRAQAYEMLEKYDYAYVDFKTAMNYDLYNTNAQNGASRMLPILKDKHGMQWRENLPSQPKSPSIPWPTYVASNLNSSTTLTDTSTTMTTNSRTQTGPVVTTAQVQTTKPAAQTSTAQTTTPVAEAPPPASSATVATPSAAQNRASPTPEGGVASPTETTPTSNTSPSSSSQPSPGAGKTRSAPEKPKTLTKEERFQEFKSQGNDLVKKGAYSQAIGCYTRSIEVDSSQAVSYSNRALCYLKLELPEDAIVDCSEALKRDPKGIKALYRRAQARRMLGSFQDSIKDLVDLLKLEPNNVPAKKELEVVKDAWRKDLRDKQTKTAQESKQNQGKTDEENRGNKKKKSGKRMQIEEVTESSDEDKEPTTTKNKAPSSTSHPGNHAEGRAKPTTSTPVAEKGAVDTGRTENKKKDGAATGSKGEKVNKPSSSNVTNGVPSPKKMTAYEFMQEWTSLKKKKTVEPHAKLLKQVQPNDIPKVLSNKLDGDMLGKILNASANHLVEDDPAFTYQLLNKLRCVDRFKTVAMFLSKMDKDNMQRCINMISSKPEVCKEEDLKKLKKAYQI